MADPYVRQASGIFTGLVGSTDIDVGAPVYFDGSDWEKADATEHSKYAEAIAVQDYDSGEIGVFCRRCILTDIDSSAYTQADQYFLSASTAGTITATRPTGAANLVQVLGEGLSTHELYIDIPPVTEHHVWLTNCATTSAENGGIQLDGQNHGSQAMNADEEDIFFTLEIPSNCVGLEIAHIWMAGEDVGATPQFALSVGAGSNGEDHTATTADTTVTGTTIGSAADTLYKIACTASFDASDIWECGNLLGIKMTEKNGTSDVVFGFGINMVLLTV